uniref:Hypothetical chloroplast RF20 n=1 Tax=Nephroselmis pyriformis TaxID=156128 RepID=A0A8A2H8V4_9CHLO|nr:hypothetical chloroplast RF20 [Nephroselmis pyriformis]QSV37321.1 hypothetical chloroplast RF20 [Nephroselmis pyriformis]
METRLIQYMRKTSAELWRNWQARSRLGALSLASVLVGFTVGNLLSTMLGENRWSGSMILAIVIGIEAFNALLRGGAAKNLRPSPFLQLAQYFKTGILFGLFVDAFKVGS